MTKKKSKRSQKKSSFSQLKVFTEGFKLYLRYIVFSLVVLAFNYLPLAKDVEESVVSIPIAFGDIVTYKEPFIELFLRSTIAVLVIYAIIVLIQTYSHERVGRLMYLFAAVLVGLAAGRTFGGGIFSFEYAGEFLISIVGQLEWLGAAFLVTSVKSLKEIKWLSLSIGVLLIALSNLIFALIFSY